MLRNTLNTYTRSVLSLSNFYFICLTILLIVEINLFTTWRTDVDPHRLVFYFFGVQLLIAILPLLLIKNKTIIASNKLDVRRAIPLSIAAVFGIYYAFNLLKPLIKGVVISVRDSDILPQIQRFCREMAAGRFPYTPFNDFGWPMTPTYLPAHWLPYLPIELVKIDPRYVTFSVFTLVYLIFLTKMIKNGLSFFTGIVLLALPIFLISVVLQYDPAIWSITVEQLIMAYYLLLCVSLTTDSKAFQIVAIVLCLMSRFALIFWLPLFVFMLCTKEGTRSTIRFCAWIAVGCAALYGPFLLRDPHIFSNAQTYYDLASVGEWTRSEKPVHMYNGLSFTLYFFEKAGEVVLKIASVKKYLLIITPSVSVLLGAIWWRFKDKLDFSLFAICALKISLAVFYALITIPYSYLYVTPIIVSLAILYRFSVLIKSNY